MQESQLATCKENNMQDHAFSMPSPALCCSEVIPLYTIYSNM
jgi:hypothetical protein